MSADCIKFMYTSCIGTSLKPRILIADEDLLWEFENTRDKSRCTERAKCIDTWINKYSNISYFLSNLISHSYTDSIQMWTSFSNEVLMKMDSSYWYTDSEKRTKIDAHMSNDDLKTLTQHNLLIILCLYDTDNHIVCIDNGYVGKLSNMYGEFNHHFMYDKGKREFVYENEVIKEGLDFSDVESMCLSFTHLTPISMYLNEFIQSVYPTIPEIKGERVICQKKRSLSLSSI